MIRHKIPISELVRQGYPSEIIELIKRIQREEAASIIGQSYKKHIPYVSNYFFLKHLIKRRIKRGEYTQEEIKIFNDWIDYMENVALPSYGDDPHQLISKATPAEERRLLLANLLEEINPEQYFDPTPY